MTTATTGIESDLSHDERDEQRFKERRLQRRDQEQKKSLWKKITGQTDAETNDKIGYLLEKLPYYVTPSYVSHNGRYMTIVELSNRPGSNREMTYSTILDMIPVDPLDGVEMHLMINDSVISGNEKKRIIRENAHDSKKTIQDTQTQGSETDRTNQSHLNAANADMEDYDDYENILDSPIPVVVFTIRLLVIAPDRETIEDQIQTLNVLLDQRHEGAQWGSLGGDQTDRFSNLFQPVREDRFSMTTTGGNYAGLNFSVNAGLNDSRGLPIGRDSLSLSGSTAFFDMDGTLKRQGIIAIPRSATMHHRYPRMDGDKLAAEQIPCSSIMAQYTANHAVLNGHRAHHMVMNDFDYLEADVFFRKSNVQGMFCKYDVANVTINPLQGFGDIEDVVQVYSRLQRKIALMFDIMNDLTLSPEHKAIVSQVIHQFYIQQGLWTQDAEQFKKRTKIVNIANPEEYPTLGRLISGFTTMAEQAMKQAREHKTDRVEALKAKLEGKMTTFREVLGRPTSITERDDRQVYYDFKRINDDPQMVQLQFVNLLDYIIWTAAPGDVIVFHGCDKLWQPVMVSIAETIKAAQNKGIRFLFTFDTISADENTQMPMSDLFSMQGSIYSDLDTDVDWSMVGRCMSNEVGKFENALDAGLSATIRQHMQSKSECQVLVHRRQGDVNNFVHANPVI